MQGGQGTMSSVMEAAANVAASAKSGLDKTKVVVEEKKERMTTSDAVDLAELRKCKAYAQNAAISTGSASPGFTDGAELNTIGSFRQQPDNLGAKSQCLVPTESFVVEDDVGSQCGVVRAETGEVGSAENEKSSGGTEVVDANPTHTGMPAPVVEPDGVGSGFNNDTNTGSGTHFAMNYK